MKPFERFDDLFYKGKVTKKYEVELEKLALQWFRDNFNATFGSHTVCNTKHLPFLWHYSLGSLILSVKDIGGYYYKFIIKAAMFHYLNTPAYKEGFKYVRGLKRKNIICSRDSNPYQKLNFYDRAAWDCGYMCGLYNKHINTEKVTIDIKL